MDRWNILNAKTMANTWIQMYNNKFSLPGIYAIFVSLKLTVQFNKHKTGTKLWILNVNALVN